MDDVKDIIQLLQYLIPGFVSAWVFYGTTSFQKPSAFERIVQALIFTLFVNALVYLTKVIFILIGQYASLGAWGVEAEVTWSVFYAIGVGFVASYFANNDKFHKFLRDKKFTRESSYPSEWFGSFMEPTYIVLHLSDGKRLYGWPMEWPSGPDEGHFVLVDMVWLKGTEIIEMPNVDRVMVSAKDVSFIQFMNP